MGKTNEVYFRKYLPKHIVKDGAKWLMMPSKAILDGLSVWPECQNNTTRVLHFFCVLSYLLTMFGNVYHVKRKDVGLGSIAFALSLFILSIETVVRRLLTYFYRERLSKVLSRIYFEFWPSNVAGKTLHEELSRTSRYLFYYCSAYMFSAFLCGVQYILVPYSNGNLPFRTSYPFNWEASPYYELLYAWQSFLSLEVVFNICGLDLFFVSLLFNCVAQFKLLREFMKTNFEKAIRKDNAEARDVMLVCIQRHKKIIRVCNEINDLFSYFILVQYLTSMGTVCLSSFVATAVPEDVGQAFTYLMGHICEILIYCYMGNDLIIESTEFSNAVYECGWHLSQGDRDLQKSLLMVMLRSQKPIKMLAGGFGFLSLSSFVKLIQFSFSVYTLLNSMMKKQDGSIRL